ncbi:FAD-dependent oxidoreductase (plasmid) [Deinococcus radiomollis]|uniref:NAD(P)/FAD-dependent oxidoreductase n=1 Tax=Deinococcus radiomollis TaxID=468916 RepID=UPI0038919086
MAESRGAKRAVVIGGGLVGAACAEMLSRRGCRVTVVESGVVGGGATAAGMGHLVVMDDSPAQLALTSRSLELWETLAPQLPARAEYRRCGTVWVAQDDEELSGVLPKRAAYHAAGREAELLGAAELARLEPDLRPGLAGGLRVPGDSVVYAPVVARFLLERAGAEVVHGRAVALVPGGVQLADGRVLRADLTVVAAGIQATELLPELPLRPRRGQLVITERTGSLPGARVNHQLVELGYLKSAHGSDEDSVAFNVQPRATGQLLIGSSRQFSSSHSGAEIDWPLLRRMLDRAVEYLPGLRHSAALRVWTGLRAASPDHLPIIGAHPERAGVYLAAGHEGLGITTALGTAEILAAELGGAPSPLSAHDFGARRAGLRQAAHA